MKKFKYLVCDIDGTILDKDFPISEDTREALRLLQKSGFGVTLATGRNEWEARDIVEDLQIVSPVILANGAQVYDFSRKSLLYGQHMDASEIHSFLRDYKDFDITLSWHDDVGWQSLPMAGFLETCHALVIRRLVFKLPTGVSLKSSCRSSFWAFRNEDGRYEITPKSAQKGEGLLNFCRVLGLSPDLIVSVGNDTNDLSLLEAAGLGLAVGDGVDSLKERADGILVPLREEPVVAVVRWLLGEITWEALVS
jgi:hydroxymethylpyrimidine pyrophosphatase-like HAD family hydrolase